MQEILNKFFQFLQKEKMQKEEPVFAHLSKEEVDSYPLWSGPISVTLFMNFG